MNDESTKYRIAQLLAKEQINNLSDIEQAELLNWKQEALENENLYQIIHHGQRKLKRDNYVKSLNIDAAWKNVESKTNPNARKHIRLNPWIGRIAAIFLFGAILTTVFVITKNSVDTPIAQSSINIEPGSSKAVLQLHNGQMVQLEDTLNERIVEKDGTTISNQSGTLTYLASTPTQEALHNTVSVPVGGEYQLTLADGTKVWLNSDSKITFPVQFNQDKRNVWIEGEAYFEVTHDATKPFIVHTSIHDVRVLGTSFNICAYPDENNSVTTLVEGSVAVKYGDETKEVSDILEPNQQLVLNIKTMHTQKKAVNTYQYTAWKDGRLVFKNQDVNTIMRNVARWYDIDVFYQNEEVQQLTFSIDMERYDSFEKVKQIMELTEDIEFITDGRTVLVKKIY